MPDASVDLWATSDEVHFQQHGSRCRMWIPPEIKDPVLLHAPTRKSVGYFGAVRLRDGRFVFRLETGKFNGPSFFQFLQPLRPKRRWLRKPAPGFIEQQRQREFSESVDRLVYSIRMRGKMPRNSNTDVHEVSHNVGTRIEKACDSFQPCPWCRRVC